MSQHDMNIANQSFPSFRSDLNNALGALNSMHSGTSRPSGATTGTLWLDTTNSGSNSLELKFFDGSDDISFATVDTSANTINFIDSATQADLVNDSTPQLGGDLDTNSNNIQFDDAHGINDDSGNEFIIFQKTSSAVNQFDITNSATGNPPKLSATGGDSNIDLDLEAKGTGHITVRGNTNAGAIQFNCESNSHGQIVKSQPHSAGVTNELLLPAGASSTLVSLVSTGTLTNKVNIPSTETATISTSKTLDFDTYQNFILTLGSGANTLAQPSTEASNVGQTGIMVFIQPSSGSAGTVSLHGDYETVGGAGLTLSSSNSAYDVVAYLIKADNSILLSTPQLAFS